jgi:Cdc6-like AAA superfamily ATPase
MSGSCIGLLEPHIHKVFAQERVPGEDFVYKQSTEMFNILEDFCDDQTIHEPRPPLLILGDSGSGKSALLANWLQRRQRNMTRSRAAEDFVFWHAVGCTRQSMDINNLMRRLMSDLKARFELSRDVPLTQSRLSWDLPRFLELASKKGKAIIVLDGLHRLESNEGETNLSWLPLEFPPNVRIVLSATSMNTSADAKKNHVMAELERCDHFTFIP